MNEVSATNDASLPKALWIWNNHARKTLPPMLLAWLGLLVLTCLASILFVDDHVPARWILIGFIASHVVVFGLPLVMTFVMRRGFVSLAHVVFWTPGLVLVVADQQGRIADHWYSIWTCILLPILLVSLVFDLRDASIYIKFVLQRRR